MPDAPTVEVLLATRNSSRYLAPMLESLLRQTWQGFTLVVGDDVSTDDTLRILDDYAPRFAVPPRIVRRESPTGSAAANFGRLLASATADYVLLADHDDEWTADHVERGVASVQAAERELGAATPVLAHTDLVVVDATGAVIAQSYWDFKRIDPAAGRHLASGLVHATVTGCTVTMNAALVRRAGELPPAAVMHDWWLALVAAAFGALVADPRPSVSYRVHGGNVSRPRRVGLLPGLGRLGELGDMRQKFTIRYDQAQAFLDAFGPDLDDSARGAVSSFLRARDLPPPVRQVALVRGGHTWPDALRNVSHLPFA